MMREVEELAASIPDPVERRRVMGSLRVENGEIRVRRLGSALESDA